MADPVTWLLIGGTVISAVGAIQSGQALSSRQDFQAQLSDQQAEITRQQAESERVASRQGEEDFRRQQSFLMARRRAILGGSGVQATTGSPLLGTLDLSRETELQALRIRSGGNIRATRLEQQAGLRSSEADLFRSSASSASTAGFLRAGSSLLTGFGTTFGR